MRLQLVWTHPQFAPHVPHANFGAFAKIGLFEALSRLFENGYRRVETRLDLDDKPRRALFESLGFVLEGVLRKQV